MSELFKSTSRDETRAFYQGLSEGKNHRGLWGMDARFNAQAIAAKPSVLKHFAPLVAQYLSDDDTCLDLGCGTGGFLSIMAPLCGRIVGADIVPSFVEEAERAAAQSGAANVEVVLLTDDALPFETAQFDKVVMVDTIHHLEEPRKTLAEVMRVLKPGGMLLIFEPNKLNPLLTLMCIFDRNEHGLLPLGTFGAYAKLLGDEVSFEQESFNGMLVGPSGRLAVAIADFLSRRGNRLFNWLSPKIFIAARKAARR